MSLFNLSCPFGITSLIGCEIAKAEMTHFQRHCLLVHMPFTKEDKILIKNLFELKGYNARYLVGKFSRKAKMSAASTNCCNSDGLLVGRPSSRHCLLYTSPSPRDRQKSRMPSSA